MVCGYFDGWDWTELAEAWGVYIPESYAGKDMYEYAEKRRLEGPEPSFKEEIFVVNDNGNIVENLSWEDLFGSLDWSINTYEPFEDYDPIIWYINTIMSKSKNGESTRVMKKAANDIRCFARKLAESEISYLAPLWLGLSKVESDWEILRVIGGNYPLISVMWD